MRKKLTINKKLVNTWEHIDDIYEGYHDQLNNYSPQTEKILEYINSLPEVEIDIWFLYCEYNSYRMVSEETNYSYNKIQKIINKIKKEVKDYIK